MIGRLKGILLSKQPPWLLIDVNGVGYELEAPMSTIYDLPGDLAALSRIPGIGKKTAERIVVELRDRVDGLVGTVSSRLGGGVPNDPVSEASVALQSLGYKPAEVMRMVKDAATPDDSAEDIIRKALRAALR